MFSPVNTPSEGRSTVFKEARGIDKILTAFPKNEDAAIRELSTSKFLPIFQENTSRYATSSTETMQEMETENSSIKSLRLIHFSQPKISPLLQLIAHDSFKRYTNQTVTAKSKSQHQLYSKSLQ